MLNSGVKNRTRLQEALVVVGAVAFACVVLPLFFKLYGEGDNFIVSQLFTEFRMAAQMGVAVCGIVLVMLRFALQLKETLSFVLVLSSALVCCVGLAIIALCGFVVLPAFIVYPTGIVFGLGLGVLILAWSLCIKDIQFNQMLVGFSLVCAGAILFDNLLTLLPNAIAGIAYLAALLVASIPPLLLARRRLLAFSLYDVQDSDVQDSEPNDGVKGVGGGSLVDMVVVVSTSVIGLVLFAIASNAQIGVISTTGPSNTSIGMAGSSLIIAIAASIFRRTSLLPFTYSILFPVVAGLLVILDSAALGSMLFQLGAAGVFFFFSAIAVFSIVYILAVSIKGEFAAPQVVGVSLALLSVASLIGHLLANPGVDSIEFGSVFLVICTCYFIFVLLAPAIQSWRERHLETESSSASSETAVEEFYMSKCAAIAQDYYLSQRESEVLYYVGKGYNASYISKALYISDGTARTHLNNIYHKLGVNSKMQIIDMFGN